MTSTCLLLAYVSNQLIMASASASVIPEPTSLGTILAVSSDVFSSMYAFLSLACCAYRYASNKATFLSLPAFICSSTKLDRKGLFALDALIRPSISLSVTTRRLIPCTISLYIPSCLVVISLPVIP